MFFYVSKFIWSLVTPTNLLTLLLLLGTALLFTRHWRAARTLIARRRSGTVDGTKSFPRSTP